ncbi:MAG TPA: bifunctional diaminohydroxyphosphoribosylaminopyrimidine deaminase/5-amino-6-(5-phosphoribosylamino)uracil reductase RibD [Acidimicrobiales bacterium]|nr:bifunctional diaminohydroxyphosphoribosylaminopyrimidine deaminase/5-amino-6-(5-phosphoribosylamino)uracil reductase RibD [Acidimicrobiales bacterium]
MRPADPPPDAGERGEDVGAGDLQTAGRSGPRPEGEGSDGVAGGDQWDAADAAAMARALELAASVRTRTSPNPWVGCVVEHDGEWFEGATEPPGGAHAEVVALRRAGARARGATLYTTLEPCAHHGRTPPCVGAIRQAGVARVVVGMTDPDPQVRGSGLAQLRESQIAAEVGLAADQVTELLAPYLKHRRTGLPWVVLKLACTLDGRIAAPDGSSRWLTGTEALADAHRLRAESDAVLVGSGTVRTDDPQLTVRLGEPCVRQPLRVVLGRVPPGARVEPALEMDGEPAAVLGALGAKGILQVLLEGGAHVAHAFHEAGLVDRYVFYLVPALFGGDDAVPMFRGRGAATLDGMWRGRLVSVTRLGRDLRVELERGADLDAAGASAGAGAGATAESC